MPDKTPISQLQATELLTSIDALSADIDHLTVELRKTNLRATRTTIVAVIGVAAMLFAVWVALGNRQALHEAEKARIERSTVSCVRANVQIKASRAAFVGSILTFADDPDHLTADQMAALDGYRTAVESALPYRDCSDAGIAAYFDSVPADPATTP